MMAYVLAVDGGNTKTIALIADIHGSILGTGRSGSSDIYNTVVATRYGLSAVDFAIANIEAAVQQALHAAHIQPAMLTASVFNLAGADWPEDFEVLQGALRERQFGHSIQVQNDALGILHAGSIDNVGVALVCGTGAATGARGYDGRIWHSSFWQRVHGSEHLSQQTIDAVLRVELGLEEPTMLTQRVLQFFRLQTIEEVLHTLTARQPSSDASLRVHGLTALLFDEAEAGDCVARRIIRQHGHALGDYAIVAARRVGIEQTSFPLILAGGVFRHPTLLLADAITERVRDVSPTVQMVRPSLEPIIGALFTALERASIKISPSILNQVLSTQPVAPFFDTTS
ncbi:MAG TPA: BadF/BadG/BcrA/BcrD ATPase family protein [Ktedonobacteraceae bacterium]|nr:BadF/BadG/BcrA/BcrD ATPase family protein [Ktedonobacteraceae bacterium]